ncbi:N-acetylmuramoyl-L-alanine amidase [Neobacillus mesonae]|nr:N-acetylmuramoyl-L-alanine amidase [Neobacillus mesonae]
MAIPVHAEPKHVKDPEISHHLFRHPVIIIDAGHGGIDGGTSAEDLLEKDINLAISQKVYMMLKSKGYAVVLNRNDDYALSDDNTWLKSHSRHMRDLAQRKGLSDHLPSDLIVSIHVNWSKKSRTHGPIVLHQDEARSYLLANSIQDSLNQMYQTNRQVEWGKPFYLLNHVNKPSVIVEAGFISNSVDRAVLGNASGQKKIAQAISSGIIYYLSVM